MIWCLENVYLWYPGWRTRWCCWRAPWTTTTTTYSARYIMESCGFAVCWCGSWINRFYILISLSVKCISFQKVSYRQTYLLTDKVIHRGAPLLKSGPRSDPNRKILRIYFKISHGFDVFGRFILNGSFPMILAILSLPPDRAACKT